MSDDYAKIERNKSTLASVEEVGQSAVDTALKNLHTCLPGIIHSYNATKQTAEVQPAIKRIFTEKGAVNLPLCVDVPVVFPGGGNFYLTFPIIAGDECLLIFSERCIDGWAIDGVISEPEDYRQHDLSDGFAFVGVNSQPNKLAGVSTAGAELRNRAGTVKMTMNNSGIVVTGNLTINGQVIANGHRIDETHRHINSGGAGLGGVVQ
jgi:hypothetical protein